MVIYMVILISLLSHFIFATNFDSEIISYITKKRIQNYTLVEDVSVVIQINSRQGERHVDIFIPYNGNSNITYIKAHSH